MNSFNCFLFCVIFVLMLDVKCLQQESIKKNGDRDPKIVCSLPYDKGSCYELMQRWYFNPVDRKCHLFEYKGCGGNYNNFFRRDTCEFYCMGNSINNGSRNPDIVCLLPPEEGVCNPISKWYYDSKTKTCHKFSYNGFGGNYNNFYNESVCELYCNEKTNKNMGQYSKHDCTKPYDEGHCDILDRWYYNSKLGKCTELRYKGYNGNNNNFYNRNTCEFFCQGIGREEDSYETEEDFKQPKSRIKKESL